ALSTSPNFKMSRYQAVDRSYGMHRMPTGYVTSHVLLMINRRSVQIVIYKVREVVPGKLQPRGRCPTASSPSASRRYRSQEIQLALWLIRASSQAVPEGR